MIFDLAAVAKITFCKSCITLFFQCAPWAQWYTVLCAIFCLNATMAQGALPSWSLYIWISHSLNLSFSIRLQYLVASDVGSTCHISIHDLHATASIEAELGLKCRIHCEANIVAYIFECRNSKSTTIQESQNLNVSFLWNEYVLFQIVVSLGNHKILEKILLV